MSLMWKLLTKPDFWVWLGEIGFKTIDFKVIYIDSIDGHLIVFHELLKLLMQHQYYVSSQNKEKKKY